MLYRVLADVLHAATPVKNAKEDTIIEESVLAENQPTTSAAANTLLSKIKEYKKSVNIKIHSYSTCMIIFLNNCSLQMFTTVL